ncbi:MAG: ABC transporter ATP-binding protein, partial [Chloroflexota bacterium]
GELSLVDAPNALKKQYGSRTVSVEFVNGTSAMQSKAFSLDDIGRNEDFIRTLREATSVETIHTQETTLENIFIEVTGERLT